MEELTLTTPAVKTETVRKWRVSSFTMDVDGQLLQTVLKSDIGTTFTYAYHGAQAVTLIRQLNVLNMVTKSLNRRILERLATDGILPGTVGGTPDAP